jgi:hypothetical protein
MMTDPAELNEKPTSEPDATEKDGVKSPPETGVPKHSQVQLTFELAPGTRVRVTVESVSGKQTKPADQADLPAQDATGTGPGQARVLIEGGVIRANIQTPAAGGQPVEISVPDQTASITVNNETSSRVTFSAGEERLESLTFSEPPTPTKPV